MGTATRLWEVMNAGSDERNGIAGRFNLEASDSGLSFYLYIDS